MQRKIKHEEILLLKSKFGDIVDSLIVKMENYPFIGIEISLTEEEDLSKLGAELGVFTPQDIVEESEEYFPGIIVIKYGYIPFASCMEGSGDPYFFKDDKIYRVPHESCIENDKLDLGMVEEVCSFSLIIEKLKGL